ELTTGGQVAINGRKASIRGAELEIAARPSPRVQLHLAGGYADARIDDFNGTALFVGNRLPNAQAYTLNLGGRFVAKRLAAGELLLRVDYNHTGRIYFAEDNEIYQPAYATVDAQIALESERWAASIWGRNIFSEHYVVSAFSRSTAPV